MAYALPRPTLITPGLDKLVAFLHLSSNRAPSGLHANGVMLGEVVRACFMVGGTHRLLLTQSHDMSSKPVTRSPQREFTP